MGVNGFPNAWRPGGSQSPRALPSSPSQRYWAAPANYGRGPSVSRITAVRPITPSVVPRSVAMPRRAVASARVPRGPLPVVAAALFADTLAHYFGAPIPVGIVNEGTLASPANFTYRRTFYPEKPPALTDHGILEGVYKRLNHTNFQWVYVQEHPDDWSSHPWTQVDIDPATFWGDNPPIGTYGCYIAQMWTKDTEPTRAYYKIKHYFERTTGTAAVPATAGGQVPLEVAQVVPIPAYQPPIVQVQPVPVAWPLLRPVQNFLREVSPDPNPLPAPAARPAARPVPSVEVVVTPVGATVRPGPPHRFAPPRRGERERKTRTQWGPAWQGISDLLGIDSKRALDGATEALQFLDAVYYALPEELQDAGRNPYRKAVAIVEHFDELDLREVANNLVAMALTDKAIGQAAGQARRSIGKGGFTQPNTWYGL